MARICSRAFPLGFLPRRIGGLAYFGGKFLQEDLASGFFAEITGILGSVG